MVTKNGGNTKLKCQQVCQQQSSFFSGSVAVVAAVKLLNSLLQISSLIFKKMLQNKYHCPASSPISLEGAPWSSPESTVRRPCRTACVCQCACWWLNWHLTPQGQHPFFQKVLQVFLRKQRAGWRRTSSWGPWAKRHFLAQGQAPFSEKFLQSSVLCLSGLVFCGISSSLASPQLSGSVEPQEARSKAFFLILKLIVFELLLYEIDLSSAIQSLYRTRCRRAPPSRIPRSHPPHYRLSIVLVYGGFEFWKKIANLRRRADSNFQIDQIWIICLRCACCSGPERGEPVYCDFMCFPPNNQVYNFGKTSLGFSKLLKHPQLKSLREAEGVIALRNRPSLKVLFPSKIELQIKKSPI